MKVVLASRSPRRKQLLSLILESFEVRESHFDESTVIEEEPKKLVKQLSYQKAKSIVETDTALIIGADTVVVSPDGEIFGIPSDKEEALDMLRRLSGNRHQVITGVTLLCGSYRDTFCVKTDVYFRSLENEEIEEYVNSGEPFDKAGGYGIQGKAAIFVKKIEGD